MDDTTAVIEEQEPVAEPEAPEAEQPADAPVAEPEAEQPTDAPEAATDDAVADETGGPARDERGRFAPKDGTPPVEATPEAATPAAPFTVRALGNEYNLDGATMQPDGSVVFAAPAVQRLHELFGRAVLIHKRASDVERDRATLRAERASVDAYYKPLEEEWNKLKAAQSVDEFTELAAAMWLNKDVIDGKRELARERATLTVQQEPAPVSQEEYLDNLQRNLDQSIHETLRTVQAQYKGLTAEDWREIAADLDATRGAYLVQQQDGVYYNEAAVEAFVSRQATRLTRERERLTAAARDAAKAAKQNAAATAGAVKAPPGIGTQAPARKPATQATTPTASGNGAAADKQAARERFQRWVETGRED